MPTESNSSPPPDAPRRSRTTPAVARHRRCSVGTAFHTQSSSARSPRRHNLEHTTRRRGSPTTRRHKRATRRHRRTTRHHKRATRRHERATDNTHRATTDAHDTNSTSRHDRRATDDTHRATTDAHDGESAANDPRTPAERRPWLHETPSPRSERGVDPPGPFLLGFPVVAFATAVLAHLLAGLRLPVGQTVTTASYVTAATGYASALVGGAYTLLRAAVWARR